ncbi:GAF and ANTAR domain-containing protein [Actinoallomurus bryophytorum]|uniref:GAF domain-containing protein n=1 Tax=Actinoallomurus bryophytorum TaxID=1490222 RepID=A0A543CJI4_9ACTN|nr:GAF and ANTAR domain-containing protein [Actinoallomurus bryophytorum]TQL97200.1 GAF domain-containing protein [Actinoallomurus bryophytorum]
MDNLTVRLRDVAATLKDLQTLLEEEGQRDQALVWLAETAERAVPAAAMATATVLTEDGRTSWTATATGRSSTEFDGDQYAAGRGPWLEAARTRRTVCGDIDGFRGRWPEFAGAAGEAGLRSYLSVPLLLGDEPVLGTLTLYSRLPDAFEPVDEALIEVFTVAASATIVNSRRYRRARELADHLKIALTSRAQIEQAKGLLMAQHSITADEAFAMLSQQSQNTNAKLRDVARSILDSAAPLRPPT